MSSIISGLIGGLIATLLTGYFVRKYREKKTGGVLVFGGVIFSLGLLCLSLSGLMLWVIFFTDHRGQEIPLLCLIVVFGLGAVGCFTEYFVVKVNYDNEQIIFRSPWRGRLSGRWEHLRAVKFCEQANWYMLEFDDGTKIRISIFLMGHGHLLEKLSELGFDF